MLADYIKANLPTLSAVLNDTDEPVVEVYLCPSYIDDDGILQNCECGGKCNV